MHHITRLTINGWVGLNIQISRHLIKFILIRQGIGCCIFGRVQEIADIEKVISEESPVSILYNPRSLRKPQITKEFRSISINGRAKVIHPIEMGVHGLILRTLVSGMNSVEVIRWVSQSCKRLV